MVLKIVISEPDNERFTRPTVNGELEPVIKSPPENELWSAVLHRALIDASNELAADKQRDAIKWLYSNKCHIYSARWICDMLGINRPNLLAKWEVMRRDHYKIGKRRLSR